MEHPQKQALQHIEELESRLELATWNGETGEEEIPCEEQEKTQ